MMISEVAGRADDLRKIRGVLFTPVTVEEVLRKEFPMVAEYELIVEKKASMDEISLRVEPVEELEADAAAALAAKINGRLKVKTNLRFNVKIEKPGELPRYTLKAKRFKDLREI
jgi:phenylacetate-CoA ligase